MNAAAINDIAARHPDAFRRSLWKRYATPIGILLCILYTFYCAWFFSVAAVLEKANWNLADAYLADWVSYEIRPDIEFKDNHLTIDYSRFSKLGSNPDPDWVAKQMAVIERQVEAAPAPAIATNKSSQDSFMAPGAPTAENPAAPSGQSAAAVPETVRENAVVAATVTLADGQIAVTPNLVTVTRGAETIVFEIAKGSSVTPRTPLPDWIEQRRPGSTAYVSFGFLGRAEVQNDEVVAWRRFFGWANFVFDTNSPFWGKPFSEVASLIVAGARIDPSRSNAALAWDNILNNAEWQHGDVWLKLLQTIVMAFVGTVLASIVAFPLAFLAARNVTPSRIANQVTKRFFDFLRSVDMLIWALFFTRGFGPGPLAGMSAIFFTDTGTLGKLYSEALENIDDKQREGIRSVGATPAMVQRYGVLPQVLPVFLSQSLYFWESNTRSATIIGAVGAGGIGLKLWEAMRTNTNWANVFYMVLLILLVVFIFDSISSYLRRKLMGTVANSNDERRVSARPPAAQIA
ncbi:phosphonate ABC transporter, permease protein PhnE [Mesorhizobium sp.]|uniref:phosphonate ABC transporter, permease protein PhnE n=1 Tax=Mesorhizobium sp. TaxID=1871066 RepID=UPI000FE438A4|nr:phosphonate ABC transporter, permease protein PhnE [Mesorhizobium sp.]RWN53144.1 MAG: phosphonate ABC transporter, permease protein PhnE [Mesorhizobium sp.]RWN73711.1 MAG: phosphonate ABC transporter, permease protein PhnE [Mesorhizobium sp.]RWN76855.1 MAG: phosphonate ABC transporter, permease protein PhnE [Mesorhizobium sp.]RWN88030.1 MAG: phosphonate ABC transporter, permease protein PhnE [Mesorhizobium sp.]RWO12409.1 MAG: phosphonate ABC transporter, permease protein PhnE [Mesorhizobium